MLERSAFDSWLDALERRHLADLRFSEVTRALRALSADYVQRRGRVRHAALEGRGKRAAFALFYGPLHFLAVSRIARALSADACAIRHVTDLGCGTGAAGAAFAAVTGVSAITGVDRHAWAVEEAAWTYRHFGLRHRTVRGDASRVVLDARRSAAQPGAAPSAVVAAYTVNELTDGERDALLIALLDRAAHHSGVLIVEPIARGFTPWWDDWTAAFRQAGGRADQWRFTDALPERVRAFDRAAGLDHREQTARSLWVPSRGR